MLSQIRHNLERLLSVLKKQYPTDPRTQRLEQKVNLDNISESSPNSTYTSYSVNKGEKIVFCLRQHDPQEQLIDLNTMTFVAIHELAHIMTLSVGHTDEFWNNMKFLLGLSISKDVGIYQYQDYQRSPKSYCGITISDTPLKL
jgi:predicted metal-dependent hydrolase